MILRRGQIIIVLFSVWILAIILPKVRFAPANWEGLRQRLMERPLSLETLLGIVLALAAILFAGLVLFLWRGKRKKRKGDDSYRIYREPISPPWSMYVVFFVLLAFMAGLVWWAHHPSKIEREAAPPYSASPSEKERTEASVKMHPEVLNSSESPQFIWLAYLLAISLLTCLSWMVWRFLKEHPGGEKPDILNIGQIADRAALDLERGAELSDVVLRCYRDMCKILRRKVAPRPEMTAREFARHLKEAGVREGEVAQLTALFEKVRYGQYIASAEERAGAVTLLQAIKNHYGKVSHET